MESSVCLWDAAVRVWWLKYLCCKWPAIIFSAFFSVNRCVSKCHLGILMLIIGINSNHPRRMINIHSIKQILPKYLYRMGAGMTVVIMWFALYDRWVWTMKSLSPLPIILLLPPVPPMVLLQQILSQRPPKGLRDRSETYRNQKTNMNQSTISISANISPEGFSTIDGIGWSDRLSKVKVRNLVIGATSENNLS